MNTIICIKQVPGTTNVEVDPVTGVLKRDGLESKMNPFDLFAIEVALKIKEEQGGKVSCITMGPPQAKQVIQESFYMGVDDGYLLTDRKFAGADVWATSYTLSQGIKKIDNYDLIVCGKQTTDGDTAQVGPELAEFLDIPHVANVNKILEITSDSITVEMNMEETVEIQKVMLPCLITVEKDINTPRLPSYRRKLKTQDREISNMSIIDFEDQNEKTYGLNGSPTQVERIFPPESNVEKKMFEGSSETLVNELYALLKDRKFI